jgi:hypothetical protein
MAHPILPTACDFHGKCRDLLHAANLRHGTDGFTSPPKEGMLRIFSPNKVCFATLFVPHGIEPVITHIGQKHYRSREIARLSDTLRPLFRVSVRLLGSLLLLMDVMAAMCVCG